MAALVGGVTSKGNAAGVGRFRGVPSPRAKRAPLSSDRHAGRDPKSDQRGPSPSPAVTSEGLVERGIAPRGPFASLRATARPRLAVAPRRSFGTTLG